MNGEAAANASSATVMLSLSVRGGLGLGQLDTGVQALWTGAAQAALLASGVKPMPVGQLHATFLGVTRSAGLFADINVTLRFDESNGAPASRQIIADLTSASEAPWVVALELQGDVRFRFEKAASHTDPGCTSSLVVAGECIHNVRERLARPLGSASSPSPSLSLPVVIDGSTYRGCAPLSRRKWPTGNGVKLELALVGGDQRGGTLVVPCVFPAVCAGLYVKPTALLFDVKGVLDPIGGFHSVQLSMDQPLSIAVQQLSRDLSAPLGAVIGTLSTSEARFSSLSTDVAQLSLVESVQVGATPATLNEMRMLVEDVLKGTEATVRLSVVPDSSNFFTSLLAGVTADFEFNNRAAAPEPDADAAINVNLVANTTVLASSPVNVVISSPISFVNRLHNVSISIGADFSATIRHISEDFAKLRLAGLVGIREGVMRFDPEIEIFYSDRLPAGSSRQQLEELVRKLARVGGPSAPIPLHLAGRLEWDVRSNSGGFPIEWTFDLGNPSDSNLADDTNHVANDQSAPLMSVFLKTVQLGSFTPSLSMTGIKGTVALDAAVHNPFSFPLSVLHLHFEVYRRCRHHHTTMHHHRSTDRPPNHNTHLTPPHRCTGVHRRP
jgi:hypothetical protein